MLWNGKQRCVVWIEAVLLVEKCLASGIFVCVVAWANTCYPPLISIMMMMVMVIMMMINFMIIEGNTFVPVLGG